jgi:hypothetical protein
MVQQYVKLTAGSVVDTSIWVCIDSDVFFLRHMDEADFYSRTGRPVLLELIDWEGGPTAIEFRNASARLLGIRPEKLDPRVLYTYPVFPMERGVVDDLFRFIERRKRVHWWEAMALAGATECETYGLFAHHIHGLRNVVPEDRRWCLPLYDVANFDAMLRYAVNGIGAKTVMIDAHLNCDPSGLHDAVRSHWIT